MITDLLARKDRFNVPGTAANSNWSRRMQKTVAGLNASPAIRKRMQIHPRAAGEDGENRATDEHGVARDEQNRVLSKSVFHPCQSVAK